MLLERKHTAAEVTRHSDCKGTNLHDSVISETGVLHQMSHSHSPSTAFINFSYIQKDQTLMQIWLSDSLCQALKTCLMHN